jgi:hypothetical protein
MEEQENVTQDSLNTGLAPHLLTSRVCGLQMYVKVKHN